MNPIQRLVLIVCSALLCCAPVYAFKFTPIEAVFAPAGRGTVQSFQLENLGQKPTAIQLSVHRRSLDRDGAETLSSADDVFTVYPTQLVLMPGTRQSVRLQWRGAASLEHEQAFRLVAEQLPLELDSASPDAAALKLLVKYMASVYVRPDGTAARLDANATPGPAGTLELVLNNTGSEHTLIDPAWLNLSLDGKTVPLAAEQVAVLRGKNILALSERAFLLPWNGPVPTVSLVAQAQD